MNLRPLLEISAADSVSEATLSETLASLRRALKEAGYTDTVYVGLTLVKLATRIYTVCCRNAGKKEFASINIFMAEHRVLTTQLNICSKPRYGIHILADLSSVLREEVDTSNMQFRDTLTGELFPDECLYPSSANLEKLRSRSVGRNLRGANSD